MSMIETGAIRTEAVSLLRRNGIRPRRSLGQNFLVDPGLSKVIVDAAQITRQDHVVEIGTGLGALTGSMAERAHCVITFEIDKKLYNLGRARFAESGRVQIVHEDGARFEEFLDRHMNAGPIRVVSNLPYSGALDIVMSLLNSSCPIVSSTLLVQKEVFQRMVAGPRSREYGPLSVCVQSLCHIRRLREVPRGAFHPVPHVDSVLLQLTWKEGASVRRKDARHLFKNLSLLFSHRRKKFKNILADIQVVDAGMFPPRLLESRVEEWESGEIVAAALRLGWYDIKNNV